ncbi:MAG: UDP-N-acetylglucosamine 2-epimerase (non-hydrolyzing) [Bacteriovoracaceae bacterium]|nr:UDP-N-acetylglucosamine 2-epimerase (non-hydrolyzing) [Bacteriovoracaceae bacterium]
MKVALVVGTRPEVIKMSSLMLECQRQGIDFFVLHSNQHYSPDMDAIFFEELNLPAPKYNLNVGSGTHSNQTGNILIKIEPIFEDERPDVVLVQGDTNTVLSAALAAAKLNIPVGHVEAGLRSYDRTMPEETNRIVTDHLSEFLFAVTSTQEEILLGEGKDCKKIDVVGNTVVDALIENIEIAKEKSTILADSEISSKGYFLVTAHRSSNVDNQSSLEELFSLINGVLGTYTEDILWPVHPRAMKNIKKFNIEIPGRLKLIEPVGYLDFLHLQNNAKLILTDSGGIQEEACALKVPCVTLRENTERPETVDVGASILVGRDKTKCLDAMELLLSRKADWKNPFGDGSTARQILEILRSRL